MKPTWEQFARAGRFALGAGVIVWGVVVTANSSPSVLPYVLVAGLGLVGLSISFPWENKRKNGGSDAGES